MPALWSCFLSIQTINKYLLKCVFDLGLAVLSIACLVVMFISSSDVMWSGLNDPVIQTWFAQFQTGNQIAFDLSVGLLASIFMYYLVVRVPEQSKRRRLRANLAETYQSFKKDSIAIYLNSCGLPVNSDRLDLLSDYVEFRKFFDAQHAAGQKRWEAVANGLDESHLKSLVVELEILMQEIHFTLGSIDVRDHKAFYFLKQLSKVIYRSKNWTTEYDDVKSMMSFLWSLHTGWSWIEGYSDSDPVAEIIAVI